MTDNTNVDLKHALGPAPNQASSSSNNVNVHDNSSPRPLQFTPIPEAGPAPQGTADKSSRWTARDDVILADALIAQKSLGRSHNAVFTLDAWNEIVEQLKGSEIISGGAQKTMVQCKARWQRLKIEYRTVKHLRAQPGFSWDDSTQMVTALAATWDQYISEHRDAQPWRKKSFPAYGRVAHILEDEQGHDAGEEQFKRRWVARAIKSPGSSTDGSSTCINGEGSENAPPSTSVFSVSAPPDSQNIQFAAPITTSGTMSVPFNGSGLMHNYRINQPQTNSKRRQSPSNSNESISTKRSRSTTSNTTGVPPEQQQLQQPPLDPYAHTYPYGYTPVPQMSLPPTPVSTASVPPAAGPISPAYGPYSVQPTHVTPQQLSPPSIAVTQSRIATAIQLVEENENLTEDDFVRAIQLFQRRPEAVEAYVTIKNQKLRSSYLNKELKGFVI